MRDPLTVRLVERVGNLDRVLERVIEREWSLRQSLGQRLAVEVLHHQEVHRLPGAGRRVLAPDVVQRADVWMIQCGDGARLTLEALARLGVVGEARGQDLDRHRAIESRVARFVDLAHPARADL